MHWFQFDTRVYLFILEFRGLENNGLHYPSGLKNILYSASQVSKKTTILWDLVESAHMLVSNKIYLTARFCKREKFKENLMFGSAMKCKRECKILYYSYDRNNTLKIDIKGSHRTNNKYQFTMFL